MLYISPRNMRSTVQTTTAVQAEIIGFCVVFSGPRLTQDFGGNVRAGKFVTRCLAAACAVFTLAAYPVISAAATAEQAKAFSERASAHIKQVGEKQAFADFTRPDGGFVEGELYVFCYDRKGVNMAHGGNKSFVGRNLLHIKDPDGTEPNLMIVRMGFDNGRGWVDFKWPNPVTKRIEDKSAYVIRTNDVVCGVGYYKG